MSEDKVLQEKAPKGNAIKGLILVYGAVVAVLGVIALLHPVNARVAGGLLIGVAFVEYGGFAIASGHLMRSWVEVLMGLVTLAAGAIVLFDPFPAVSSLLWIIGAWLVIMGGAAIISAYKVRDRQFRGARIYFGTVDAVLGAVLLFFATLKDPHFLIVAVAIAFLLRGTYALVFAFKLPPLMFRAERKQGL